jgi:hypothetical protein
MTAFFKTRIFAALAVAVSLAFLWSGNWQAALGFYLACNLLTLRDSRLFSRILGAQTFTTSQAFLQYMQTKYGSANFASYQSIRYPFYCFVNYPAAGNVVFNFFGFAASGNAGANLQYTNLQKAGSFGLQFLLLKSIQCGYYVSTAVNLLSAPLAAGVAADADNPAADFLYGLFQAGYFELDIGNKPYVQIPKPFLYAPPADGEIVNLSATGVSGTAAGGGSAIDTFHTLIGHAELNRNQNNRYLVDPPILIETEQSFTATIGYPTGAIPIICSNIFTTNLFIGVMLDGILIRPVQ